MANNVEVLVHATGPTMTWAKEFYSAYQFELSQQASDDMILDKVVDLTGGNAKATITFIDVLKAILVSADAGYREVMIVAHGHPKGLIMPLGPGLGSADKDSLPLLTFMAGIVIERDRIQAIKDAKQQLTAWKKLLGDLSGTTTAGAPWGKTASSVISDLTSSADAQALLETMAPTIKGVSVLKHKTALEVMELRNKVVAKKLQRVEVRACNLGQDKDGMAALREFLGAAKVLAPTVKTFYGKVQPTTTHDEAAYKTWLKKNTPWLLKSGKEPAGVRTYQGDSLYLKLTDADATPLAVLKLTQPNLQTCMALGAKKLPYRAVKILVDTHFDIKKKLKYQSGAFYIGGLDPVAGRTPQNPSPAAANGKAFVVASEPEYRNLIASNP